MTQGFLRNRSCRLSELVSKAVLQLRSTAKAAIRFLFGSHVIVPLTNTVLPTGLVSQFRNLSPIRFVVLDQAHSKWNIVLYWYRLVNKVRKIRLLFWSG